MRVTNVDALSAYFDRLISEKIKWYFFNKDGKEKEAIHQEAVIKEIRIKLVELFDEAFKSQNYEYIGEKRTFDEAKLILDVEKLVTDDLGVGAAYYDKSEGEPSLEKFMVNEAKLRVANESRGRQKNKIDEVFSRLINGEK
tara:strand:+ start:1005 stop:1427 length:423 start_codon:yes stop_codon:yes gene_type:complete